MIDLTDIAANPMRAFEPEFVARAASLPPKELQQLCQELVNLKVPKTWQTTVDAKRNEDNARQRRAKKAANAAPTDSDSDLCTDTANAERLIKHFGDQFRYCGAWGKFFVWDGTRWQQDKKNRIEHFAKQTARKIYAEAAQCENSSVRTKLATWAKRSESSDKRAAMVRCARSEPDVAVDFEDFDRNPMLFNVANGTIELESGKLRPHNPRDLITKLSPVVWDPEARAPLFEKFLTEVLPDAEVRLFLQRFAGCCLSGDVSDRVFVFLSGKGRNGKTLLMKIFRAVLGEYAIIGAPDLLMAKKEGGHPTELADLFGARLVSCQEVPKGRTLNEQRVKELCGDEGAIKARRMKEDFWEFAPTFKIAIAGNHPPVVLDDTDSIWDRMRKILFGVRIDNPDKKLFSKLKTELPGILAWFVAGCADWQAHGLPAPKAIEDATKDYRDAEDLIGRFLADCCVLHPEARATVKGLSDALREWCQANSERPISRKSFSERLANEGCSEKRTNKARGWLGVRLLDPAEIKARDDASDEVTLGDTPGGITPRETSTRAANPLPASPLVTLSPHDPEREAIQTEGEVLQ